jgi:XRE family transcriptional regulator, fatty acid utilization regulator
MRRAPRQKTGADVTRQTIVGLGRRVRAFRLAAGISQGELGRLAGIQYKFVSLVELGKSNPSIGLVARIANGLGCELVDLIPHEQANGHLSFRAVDVAKAREAIDVLQSVLKPRQRSAKG